MKNTNSVQFNVLTSSEELLERTESNDSTIAFVINVAIKHDK